jgi:Flp pilus assembly protein CpaB
MGRRIAAITFAILLAALGAAGGLFLILTADKRAQDRIQDPVTVLVANKDLPVGTTAQKIRADGLVEERHFPRSVVDQGALTELGPDYDKQTLQTPVRAGTMLMAADFGTAADAPLTPEGEAQVQLKTTNTPDSRFRPGAQVIVFRTVATKDRGIVTQQILERATLLSVSTQGGVLRVWVAVNPDKAGELVTAMNTGTLYLAVLSEGA